MERSRLNSWLREIEKGVTSFNLGICHLFSLKKPLEFVSMPRIFLSERHLFWNTYNDEFGTENLCERSCSKVYCKCFGPRKQIRTLYFKLEDMFY